MKGAINGWIALPTSIEDKSLCHVVPVQDLNVHYLEDCPCQPKMNFWGGDTVAFIHNAYDGRDEVRH